MPNDKKVARIKSTYDYGLRIALDIFKINQINRNKLAIDANIMTIIDIDVDDCTYCIIDESSGITYHVKKYWYEFADDIAISSNMDNVVYIARAILLDIDTYDCQTIWVKTVNFINCYKK